ncbi:hypothetical protein GLYMA_19G239350v4 [Glycine max]|nr:hypothetical protein GLYMA_19G239350v4 [Glycine max]KAH1079310.1 hypothetical protein GYH30_054055 [Glycine max]
MLVNISINFHLVILPCLVLGAKCDYFTVESSNSIQFTGSFG